MSQYHGKDSRRLDIKSLHAEHLNFLFDHEHP